MRHTLSDSASDALGRVTMKLLERAFIVFTLGFCGIIFLMTIGVV
jgi:hypothetical protein